jgi:hypothetical protein
MPDRSAAAVDGLLAVRPTGKEWEYRRTATGAATAECCDDERSDVSIVSSSVVDRDGEVVLAGGVELTQFRANPVVTFGHRYDLLPIGRALWIKQDGDRLKAKTRYSTRPAGWTGDWLPDAIWHLVRLGDLRGKSIGFLPLDGGPPTAEEIARRPDWQRVRWVYRKALLLEYAVAPIQSNPEAVVQAVAKGLAPAELLADLNLAPKPRLLSWTEVERQFDVTVRSALARLPQTALERLERRLGRV